MPPQKTPVFEDRLRRLQEIVLCLENGTDEKGAELSLEESVKLYKEGLALSRACREQLEKVRNEIRLITEDETLEAFAIHDIGNRPTDVMEDMDDMEDAT